MIKKEMSLLQPQSLPELPHTHTSSDWVQNHRRRNLNSLRCFTFWCLVAKNVLRGDQKHFSKSVTINPAAEHLFWLQMYAIGCNFLFYKLGNTPSSGLMVEKSKTVLTPIHQAFSGSGRPNYCSKNLFREECMTIPRSDKLCFISTQNLTTLHFMATHH